jgi:hypothetical protein
MVYVVFCWDNHAQSHRRVLAAMQDRQKAEQRAKELTLTFDCVQVVEYDEEGRPVRVTYREDTDGTDANAFDKKVRDLLESS